MRGGVLLPDVEGEVWGAGKSEKGGDTGKWKGERGEGGGEIKVGEK